MKELNQKGEKFYNRWEECRKKKWQYIILHGSIYWGLPMAVVTFLTFNKFDIGKMELLKFFIHTIVFGIGGVFFGLWLYKNNENTYQRLNDDDEIAKGIQVLKANGIWNYENLRIHQENDDLLVIQNELFWLDDKNLSPDKIEESYNLIRKDFKRLQKNKDFELFTRNRKVKIQILDNSGNDTPLSEKRIDNF